MSAGKGRELDFGPVFEPGTVVSQEWRGPLDLKNPHDKAILKAFEHWAQTVESRIQATEAAERIRAEEAKPKEPRRREPPVRPSA